MFTQTGFGTFVAVQRARAGERRMRPKRHSTMILKKVLTFPFQLMQGCRLVESGKRSLGKWYVPEGYS